MIKPFIRIGRNIYDIKRKSSKACEKYSPFNRYLPNTAAETNTQNRINAYLNRRVKKKLRALKKKLNQSMPLARMCLPCNFLQCGQRTRKPFQLSHFVSLKLFLQ